MTTNKEKKILGYKQPKVKHTQAPRMVFTTAGLTAVPNWER